MTYRCVLTAEFEIRAENIVEARRQAQTIRAIGERYGRRWISRHDRDGIPHSIRHIVTRREVTRGGP